MDSERHKEPLEVTWDSGFDATSHHGELMITITDLNEFCKLNNKTLSFKWTDYKRGQLVFTLR